MAEVTMNFNNYNFSELIEINDIRRDIGNESSMDLIALNRIGADSTLSKIGPKYIEVDFSIWTKDRNTLKRRIAGILHTPNTRKLFFSDEQDKYYLAKKIGKISMKESKGYRSSGTITFVVPDGVAHAVAEQRVVGKSKVVLSNRGNRKAYPVIKITTGAETGWVGLANPTGVFELGEREEIDRRYKPKTVKLLQSSRGISTRVTTSPTGDLVGGSLTVGADGSMRLATKGPWGDGTKWAGGFNVASFAPAGTGDAVFYANFKLVAETGLVSQTGLMKIIFMDANNRIVAMYEIHKPSTDKNEATFRMYYGGNSVQAFKQFKFTPSNKESENFICSATHGTVDFEKRGGRLRFFYFGRYYHITVPELAEVAVAKVGVYIGQYGTRDLISGHFFTQLGVKAFYCERINLDVQNGVSNVFKANDVVEIDMGAAEVKVNGQSRNDLVVTGSDYLYLPVGQSDLEIKTSSWAVVNERATLSSITAVGKEPTIEVSYRERWL